MADKEAARAMVYCGRRFEDGTVREVFAEWLPDDPQVGDEHAYSGVKKMPRFAIGEVYVGACDENFRVDFSTFEATGDTASDFQIAGWSARDTAARRAKYVHASRRKLQGARRKHWMDTLDPLRREYRLMSLMEQRAMRQLVLEWLEVPR